MLLHLGQARICPSRDGLLTVNLDLQVTQFIEKGSINSPSGNLGVVA